MRGWHPASNGSGKRHWFVAHDDTSRPFEDRYYFATNGNLVRFADMAGAQRAADRLNRIRP